MLEPSDVLSTHCNVMVARVVSKVDHGVVLVRVIDVTDDALKLKAGMKVGMLYTDIEVGSKAQHMGAVEVGLSLSGPTHHSHGAGVKF